MSRPRVTIRCVAQRHAATNERIVEFFDKDSKAGGLIALWSHDGVLRVSVYRQDKNVKVDVEKVKQ